MARRITWELSDEAYEALEEIAKQTHKSKSDILREGLALRKLAQDKKAENKKLAIANEDDEIETTIFLP